jgi:hypothetical protein
VLSVFGPPDGVLGVGHPIQTLSPLGRSDARSAEIDSPAGVTRVIQVSVNSVEPSESVNRRNLLAKAYERSSFADEKKPDWPKMPFVVERFSFAGGAEGLAGA